jgi:Cation transport protein
MLAVMIRGRHRGLPLAIDRSILLPGEDLMHKMDRDYNEYGEVDSRDEAEVRMDEELSGRKDVTGAHAGEQDPERNQNDGKRRERSRDDPDEQSHQDTKGKSKARVELS